MRTASGDSCSATRNGARVAQGQREPRQHQRAQLGLAAAEHDVGLGEQRDVDFVDVQDVAEVAGSRAVTRAAERRAREQLGRARPRAASAARTKRLLHDGASSACPTPPRPAAAAVRKRASDRWRRAAAGLPARARSAAPRPRRPSARSPAGPPGGRNAPRARPGRRPRRARSGRRSGRGGRSGRRAWFDLERLGDCAVQPRTVGEREIEIDAFAHQVVHEREAYGSCRPEQAKPDGFGLAQPLAATSRCGVRDRAHQRGQVELAAHDRQQLQHALAATPTAARTASAARRARAAETGARCPTH